jgi:hypothetical protein
MGALPNGRQGAERAAAGLNPSLTKFAAADASLLGDGVDARGRPLAARRDSMLCEFDHNQAG